MSPSKRKVAEALSSSRSIKSAFYEVRDPEIGVNKVGVNKIRINKILLLNFIK